jgi:hypothetical protein
MRIPIVLRVIAGIVGAVGLVWSIVLEIQGGLDSPSLSAASVRCAAPALLFDWPAAQLRRWLATRLVARST